MAFIAQDTPDAASEAEQLPKATAPGFRLADAFTGSRTLGNLTQVTTTARLAASMAGMVPKDFNAGLAVSTGLAKIVKDLNATHAQTLGSALPQWRLAEPMASSMIIRDFNARLAVSTGVAKIVKDLNATHAQTLGSALPQWRLAEPMASSMIVKDFNAKLAASMAGMIPKDFNAGLAVSTGVAKIVKDLNATHAQTLRSALPQGSLMQSLAASGMLRDFNTSLAASIAGMVPKDVNAGLAASIAGMVPKDVNAGLAESTGVAKIVKDLNATHAAILRSALPQGSLIQSLAASGVLQDFIEMQAQLAAIARTAPSDSLSDTEFGTTLSRDSERLLFGNFVYCLVLSLVLLAYIRVTGESETDSQIFSLFVFATGLGAHQIAKLAREAAFRAYDFLYPPE
jgi:hypothetical protein